MLWHGLVEINEWVADMTGGCMERMGVNGLGLWNGCVFVRSGVLYMLDGGSAPWM